MTYTIDGNTGTWEIVCGLEVHAQVTSEAKLFSGASAAEARGQAIGETRDEETVLDAGPALERAAAFGRMPYGLG